MNAKIFSIATTSLAVIAMFVVTMAIFVSASSPINKGAYAEKSVKLPTGVTLTYVEHGKADGIPVIFLHGFTDSWRSYEYVLNRFPENFHVIAISQRGHGNSTKTEQTDNPKFFAADVAEFIRTQDLGPCVIAGHSFGGIVTQKFAIDYPQLTRAIVIEGSEAAFYDNEGIPEFVDEIKKLDDPIDRRFAEAFQWSTIVKPVDSTIVNEFINESMKVPAHVWKSIGDLLMTTDYSRELQKVQVPTLILWGDQDAICKWSGQQQLKQVLNNSRLIVYKNTGHALHWEDGDRFVKDVTTFVQELR